MRFSRVAKRRPMPSWLGALSKSQSGRDHVRRSDEPLGYSVFGLSRRAMVFWCAMGVERSLAQYRICRRHPAMFFSSVVLGCMRRLWAGRDSHLCAGADLDCFGIAYGYFGGVLLLQIRALISARPQRRPHRRILNASDAAAVRTVSIVPRRNIAEQTSGNFPSETDLLAC